MASMQEKVLFLIIPMVAYAYSSKQSKHKVDIDLPIEPCKYIRMFYNNMPATHIIFNRTHIHLVVCKSNGCTYTFTDRQVDNIQYSFPIAGYVTNFKLCRIYILYEDPTYEISKMLSIGLTPEINQHHTFISLNERVRMSHVIDRLFGGKPGLNSNKTYAGQENHLMLPPKLFQYWSIFILCSINVVGILVIISSYCLKVVRKRTKKAKPMYDEQNYMIMAPLDELHFESQHRIQKYFIIQSH